MWTLLLAAVACTPNPRMRCSRDYDPVCVSGIDFQNQCMAEAVGYSGACAAGLTRGACVPGGAAGLKGAAVPPVPQVPQAVAPAAAPACAEGEFRSEKSKTCVPKPWGDFDSCLTEKKQGACAGGYDPNDWVAEHCVVTCQAT